MAERIVIRADVSLALAWHLIERARGAAAEADIELAISVVDRAGHLVAAARMDGAAVGAMELAFGKAHTAATWGMRTGDLSGSTQPGGEDWGFNTTSPRVVVYAGGLPIEHDGQVIGGIGASGGTADQDEHCVRTALHSL